MSIKCLFLTRNFMQWTVTELPEGILCGNVLVLKKINNKHSLVDHIFLEKMHWKEEDIFWQMELATLKLIREKVDICSVIKICSAFKMFKSSIIQAVGIRYLLDWI